MPVHFTRRLDLFRDAGFPDAEPRVQTLSAEVRALGLPAQWSVGDDLSALRDRIAQRTARLPATGIRFAQRVPEWLSQRNGDLATALWLARAEGGIGDDVPGFLLAVLEAYVAQNQLREAAAYARFMLEVQFGWERVYADEQIAYAFMQQREPNPLVWQLLDELGHRPSPLHVLELGCGTGNDALGFLSSPKVESYTGVDVSTHALEVFQKRLDAAPPRARTELIPADFATLLEDAKARSAQTNLVYSYSSLHYFSSGELRDIYAKVRALLQAYGSEGFFGFGIKGKGSIWDGQGIPLYRPDVWINWDGQSRWFPSRRGLAQQLDAAGFEIRLHTLHEHWGYSEHGKRDLFHYVLCSPRSERPR